MPRRPPLGAAFRTALLGLVLTLVAPTGGSVAGPAVVRDPVSGVGAVVPPPGTWVTAHFDLAGGGAWTLKVSTDRFGRVTSQRLTAHPASSATAASSAACRDTAYSFIGGRWTSPLRWWFKSSTTPSGLNSSDVELALRRGTLNPTSARNDCGRADRVSASHSFLGRTTTGGNGIIGVLCLPSDGRNMVAFGLMPSGVLAGTCNHGSGSRIVESDVLLNSSMRWYATGTSCSSRFGLQPVMTHERGHTFGLGHVDEGRHPTLTMSEAVAPCDGSASTLGLGDMLGLEALY